MKYLRKTTRRNQTMSKIIKKNEKKLHYEQNIKEKQRKETRLLAKYLVNRTKHNEKRPDYQRNISNQESMTRKDPLGCITAYVHADQCQHCRSPTD